MLVFLFTNARINRTDNRIDINSKKIDSLENITSYRSNDKNVKNIVYKKSTYTVEDSLIVEMKSNNMKLDSIIKKMKK